MKKTILNENILMEELRKKFKLSVKDAVQLLNVSEATVRRVFNRLEKKGSAIRIYGGIQLVGDNPFLYSFDKVQTKNMSEKNKIGEYAASIIKSNSIIYIDSGTTTAQFCRNLVNRLKKKEVDNVNIYTNSIENLNILSKDSSINLIGGKFRLHRKDFYGYIAESTINKLHFTDCFLGADGFSEDLHFMTTDFDTAKLNEIVIANSDNKFILSDSSKFLNKSFVKFCGIFEPNTHIITDSKINEQEIKPLLMQKTDLIVL